MIVYEKHFKTIEEANDAAKNLPKEVQTTKDLVKVKEMSDGSYCVLVKRMDTSDHEFPVETVCTPHKEETPVD